VTRHTPSSVEVIATLRLGERDAEGRASAAPTRMGALRAVAEATVAAVRELSGDNLIASVDDITVNLAGNPPVASVVVTALTDGGEESLLGASLLHGDVERAVMRATLDALNRRLEPTLLSAWAPS
jgi:ribosomal protein S12 methylthiotransferase accessory factor YcaO